MNGLELSRAYYETFGRPMLEERFPELLPKIAVGLCGSGSECWGYDDAVSRDHDFEPGFCIFLSEEDEWTLPPEKVTVIPYQHPLSSYLWAQDGKIVNGDVTMADLREMLGL